jgi:hypothetical protein
MASCSKLADGVCIFAPRIGAQLNAQPAARRQDYCREGESAYLKRYSKKAYNVNGECYFGMDLIDQGKLDKIGHEPRRQQSDPQLVESLRCTGANPAQRGH